VWLHRLLARVRSHPGPVLIEGGEAFGAPFLMEALGQTQRLAWLKLIPADAGDPISAGNRLAEAVNRALEANLLPYALPFSYHLEILKKRLPQLRPFALACSNPEFSPALREALLELGETGVQIILIVGGSSPETFPGLHLRQTDLALTPEEAEALAGHHLTPEERQLLWRSSEGAYLTFRNGVCRLRGVPLPYIPSPQGDLVAPGNETLVSPELLLETLRRLGRHIEALDLAVMSLPERVAELLEDAGPAYQEQGLLARLHLLLESLDDRYQQHEKVLEWRLVAGFYQSDYSRLIPLIESHLQDNEAPELRARYAGMIVDPSRRFAEARRAATAATTPFTLYQLGRTYPDGKVSYEILRQSVKLAEASGRPNDVARNAGALAESLTYIGRFQEAARWGDWALQTFDREGLKDGPGRLRLLCNCAAARILTGRTHGLESTLSEAMDAASSAELGVATDVRAVLANLELVRGHLDEAERLATENFRHSPRWRLGDFAVPLVRILLERGKFAEALAEAQYAVTLTEGENDFISLPASLALGVALTLIKPTDAIGHLQRVLSERDLEASFRSVAALHLIKLGALQLADLDPDLRELLVALSPTGFRLFCGPEPAFSSVWSLLAAQHVPLRIRVLGQEEVWFNDERLDLSERALETLVLLALHPEGLTPEVLHSYLYEDEDTTLVALRSAVSRLRSLVPISAYPNAYRITVPFTIDAKKCEEDLTAGNIRAALDLYRGPLLAKSDAPGIREARLFLEERLRQSVLHLGDAEVLLPLAETLRDDLELWQAIYAALPDNDARLPLVRAQLHRVTQELRLNYN
jgi:hypothetical protein